MTTENSLFENNESVSLSSYAESSYLNYSMYVILERALPSLGDGLKPVQRRIIHSMNGLKLDHTAKYKKSARTVGDTLGKYHPHGDSACYEAMVLMAQPFSTNHTLVDGQGNWGSIDEPKSFAAMRYTESKMTSYANTLISEIKQGTVDWKLNFDGTMKEPCIFPAQLPNILINGAMGVAVGMATDIPPHNMGEVVNACVATLKSKKIKDEDILEHIKYPDFPSGGEIISPIEQIKEAYTTGRGKIVVRSTVEYDDDAVYITSVPYKVVVDKLLENIDNQIKINKLSVQMSDLSDKKNPVRIKLKIKGREMQDKILSHLFSTTELEVTIKINLNMIGCNGNPEVKPIPKIIREWCAFRQGVFVRKKEFYLNSILERLHIVEGLLVAFKNLERVIAIVREEDKPLSVLMDEFSLSEIQGKSILEIRLRQLAKLEESSLLNEHKELSAIKADLEDLLSNDLRIKKEMIGELKSACKLHQRERKTTHNLREESKILVIDDKTPAYPATVIVSKNSWIRAMKGHDLELEKLSYKTSDSYLQHCESKSDLPIIAMGDKGRFFGLPIQELPNGKSVGEPFSTKVSLVNGERLLSILPYNPDSLVLLATSKGNGFLAPMEIMDSRNKKGKQILTLPEDDFALPPVVINDETELAILTKQGRLVVIPLEQVNISNKSKGVKLVDIKLSDYENGDDQITSIVPLSKSEVLNVTVGKRKFLFDSDKRDYYRASRARRGVFFEKGRDNLKISK